MGLFDFLKKKDQDEKPATNSASTDERREKYLGDLDKTKIIRQLCDVPRERRNNAWQDELLKNIASASFQCGSPQIIQGPDEMKYFQLQLPEPNKPFECFVIEHMTKDYLLKDGLGVVLNANKSEPDWVFSYGDIVNYFLRQEFLTTAPTFFDQRKNDEILKTSERVRMGQPSESLIPSETRKVVREYFESFGLTPKIALIEWIDRGNKFEIAFNIVPDMFPNKEYFNVLMGSVKWFFPRHYSIFCKDEDETFKPL